MKTKDVYAICLTETNIDWETPHLVNQFQRILKKTWPKQNIGFCTSASDLEWNSDYKPGGTATALLNNLSSVLIQKVKDPSGIGRWIYATLLGKNNKKTTLFNVYRSGNQRIEDSGTSTVSKQQWIIMKQQRRDEHPHHATFTHLIKGIKEKQNHNHEIIVTIDGNEPFLLSTRGMTNMCRICRLYDPFTHCHGDVVEEPSRINESNRIDFIFYHYISLNLSKHLVQ